MGLSSVPAERLLTWSRVWDIVLSKTLARPSGLFPAAVCSPL
jgi:hypothetical protein